MVFEENVLRSIDELDNVLFYLRRGIEARKGSTDYNAILHSIDIPGDIIVQVSIIDAQGIMRASSAGPQPAPPVDLSDREHFKAQLDSKEDRLFISKPLIGRVSGKWSVQLSRRLLNPDGSFGGVVVVSLDPEHFTNFYEKVDLASSGSIALIGGDGVVRAAGGRSGGLKMGQDVRGTELFTRMQSRANYTFEQRDASTGQTRLVALRKVKGHPLWVTVSLDKDEVVAGSLADLRMDCIAAALLTLFTLAAMELLFRTEAGARQKSKELELTLDSMARLASEDSLTGLLNRRGFVPRLQTYIVRAVYMPTRLIRSNTRFCCSTSTALRSSTTRWVIALAIFCWSRRPSDCRLRFDRPTCWLGSEATNSPSLRAI